MGLFDFGDKAVLQEIALRVGIGFLQIDDEIRKSPSIATPMLRGLSFALKDECKKMVTMANGIKPSVLESIKIHYNGEKISYTQLFQKINEINQKVKKMSGNDIINSK